MLAGDVERPKPLARKGHKILYRSKIQRAKVRKLVTILAQAEAREIDGQTAYILPAGTQLDVLCILE